VHGNDHYLLVMSQGGLIGSERSPEARYGSGPHRRTKDTRVTASRANSRAFAKARRRSQGLHSGGFSLGWLQINEAQLFAIDPEISLTRKLEVEKMSASISSPR
jgi:hypothetical protein